jgi:transposase-like protein
MSMKDARNYWSNHLAAIRTQGGSTSTSTYARQHKLSLVSLYYWRRKLQLDEAPQSVAVFADAPKPQSKFVALRVSDAVPEMSAQSQCCTLVWSGGMRLEMSALPDPQWLAAVGRANQVVH